MTNAEIKAMALKKLKIIDEFENELLSIWRLLPLIRADISKVETVTDAIAFDAKWEEQIDGLRLKYIGVQ